MALNRRAFAPKRDLESAQRGELHDIRALVPKPPIALLVWEPLQVVGWGEGEILRIATGQKGFVTREQLWEAGFSRGAICHRVAKGWLHRYHPGVYLAGRPTLEPLGAEMAAVLLHRGHAILSGRSAARVWGLLDTIPRDVELTAVGIDRRSRPGVRAHRTACLDRRELEHLQGPAADLAGPDDCRSPRP